MTDQENSSGQGLRGFVWFGALLGLAFRVAGMGWYIIIYWYLWLILTAVHVAANLFALRRAGDRAAQIRPYVIASQILFIAAMLLQIDVGDGPVWMVGAALVGIDLDYGRWGDSYDDVVRWNWLVFLPCVVSWAVALRMATNART